MGVAFNPAQVRRKPPAALDVAFLNAFTDSKSTEDEIREIPIDQIDPWTDAEGNCQPFRLYSEEKLKDMADNIRENGILNPCIVRPRNGRYQLIAGHNRTQAAQMAKLRTIPCIVRDVDDDTAELYMIDSNLFQREQILPSERAMAYTRKLSIYRRQGRRTDLTGEEPVRAAQRVAKEAGDSARNVQRYARLTKLKPELLDLVDEGSIPVTVGSEMANLCEEDQDCLHETLKATGRKKVSIAQAEALKEAISIHGSGLSQAEMQQVLASRTEKAGRMLTVSIPVEGFDKKMCKQLKKDETLRQLLLETIQHYLEEIAK